MKDLSLHILDIVQNSISAKASLIKIEIDEEPEYNLYSLEIEDNGTGIPKDMLDKVVDPYSTSRTTRKVGLGLPLLKLNAERAGGGLSIDSEVGKGTIVKATFQYNNIDRIPIGDIAGVVVMLVSMNPKLDFIYTHKTPAGEYVFDTHEVKDALDGMSVQEIAIQKYLKEMIQENLLDIGYDH